MKNCWDWIPRSSRGTWAVRSCGSWMGKHLKIASIQTLKALAFIVLSLLGPVYADTPPTPTSNARPFGITPPGAAGNDNLLQSLKEPEQTSEEALKDTYQDLEPDDEGFSPAQESQPQALTILRKSQK